MDLINLLSYSFIQHAILAALLMSVACGITGTYIVARRMVFISGGITHASFGGVGIGFFFGFPPLAGAALFAVLAALTTENLTRRKIIRNDSIIAIMWSLGMALGIIFIYLTPGYAPNLMSFLFGSIITVNSTDLWLMPSLNPDGFAAGEEGKCASMGYGGRGRENALGQDLNRNFPDQFRDGVSQEEMLKGRAPETLAAMTWIVSNPFVLSGNLHGGSVVASYPFDDSRSHKESGLNSVAPDDAVFRHLAHLYGESAI